MQKIRVLIVDDAVVVRRMVTDALAGDPEIEVVGAAANGRIALSKIPQVNPDVVTLDIEMPELDGLGTLKELRKTHPRLPVIMFSTLTQRGAGATMDALALGANDYVTKPSNVGSVGEGLQRIREELIPKIKAFAGRSTGVVAPSPVRPGLSRSLPPPAPARTAGLPGRVDIVAIGVSTGGPNALAELLPALPSALPVPVVIVQHMPPIFTRLLAERLSAKCQVTVSEAKAGEPLRPGHVLVAPGDFHMVLERSEDRVVARLNQAPPENSCRPAVDVLFRSVAQLYGKNTLAIVLTGMGQDGLRGCEQIRAAGGRVIVQDEASSIVWGMPGFVARAGLAEKILPLDQIGGEVVRRMREGRPLSPIVRASV